MIIVGGTRVDLLETPKGILLTGEHASIKRLKTGAVVPSSQFTITATGVEIDVHTIDFSVNGAPFVQVLPTGVSLTGNVITINPQQVTFETLTIRASAEDDTYQDNFTITHVKDGEDGTPGENGSNYLIMGWWSNTLAYKLTDAGIPVVKVPDGTQAGFSVYSLKTQESTAGLSPDLVEWDLVESSEFMYMQEAYIERLQAALVTAERIESLFLRTGNLEVLNGASIVGWEAEGSTLVSKNKRVVLDAFNNNIHLKDSSMAVKTVIHSDNITTNITDYFSGSGGGSASIANLKGKINGLSGTLTSSTITLPTSGGKSYEVEIPAITLTALVDYWGSGRSATAELRLYLTNGSTDYEIGSAIANSASGPHQVTFTTAPTKRLVSGGNWRLQARLSVTGFGETGTFSGEGTVASTASTFTASEVINRTEIGANGMVVAYSATQYTFMVEDIYQIRRGNMIHQMTSSQIRVSRNAGSTWTNLG